MNADFGGDIAAAAIVAVVVVVVVVVNSTSQSLLQQPISAHEIFQCQMTFIFKRRGQP